MEKRYVKIDNIGCINGVQIPRLDFAHARDESESWNWDFSSKRLFTAKLQWLEHK